MRHIYLIGYRGSGKTSVASELSRRLGMPWVDSDVMIEASAGQSIKEIFAEKGEPEFRRLETQCIVGLAKESAPLIVSLGGGAILSERNRELIEPGNVVWLQASVQTLATRIAGDSTSQDRRPPLTDAQDMIQEVERVLKIRTPIYEACADHVVNTEGRSLDEICEEIMLWLRNATATA